MPRRWRATRCRYDAFSRHADRRAAPATDAAWGASSVPVLPYRKCQPRRWTHQRLRRFTPITACCQSVRRRVRIAKLHRRARWRPNSPSFPAAWMSTMRTFLAHRYGRLGHCASSNTQRRQRPASTATPCQARSSLLAASPEARPAATGTMTPWTEDRLHRHAHGAVRPPRSRFRRHRASAPTWPTPTGLARWVPPWGWTTATSTSATACAFTPFGTPGQRTSRLRSWRIAAFNKPGDPWSTTRAPLRPGWTSSLRRPAS